MFSAHDHHYMAHALRLAERGLYTTSPNPRVGCVLVRDGRIVGEGWHERAGGPHAEVHALRMAGEAARGANAYVTLEPCSHHGRTPPCADALVKAGVKRVVAAMADPNPQVAGSGLARLRAHGIEVADGLLEAQARALNVGFVARMTRGRPWVTLKTAASLDGRTALENGISQWITGVEARQDVQRWRARSCAVLTGIGTVLADDPQLTVRSFDIGRQPLRVIVDSRLRMPFNAKILQHHPTLIACLPGQGAHAARLREMGVHVLELPDVQGRVSLPALMAELARHDVNELLVEAGPLLNGALLDAGLVDEVLVYFAPTLLGADARGMYGFAPLATMHQRLDLEILELGRVGADIRLRARARQRES